MTEVIALRWSYIIYSIRCLTAFFIAGLIFDIIYLYSTNVMWGKMRQLAYCPWPYFFAIIPRLINLAQVWFFTPRRPAAKIDFWLNLIAIIAALVNCFCS